LTKIGIFVHIWGRGIHILQNIYQPSHMRPNFSVQIHIISDALDIGHIVKVFISSFN
jgi:hypothetical protein